MAMTEIRWHGRGGQGVKTAALLVAEVGASAGQFSQGFPEYGPERSGAPIRGYTRISDAEVRIHSAITRPDIIVVLDPSLIGTENVAEGLKENGAIIVNTSDTPKNIRALLGLEKGRVATVDAQGISIAELGRPMPNIPIIGALLKVTGMFDYNTMEKDIRHKFEEKFGGKVVEGNLKALKRAYDEVKQE